MSSTPPTVLLIDDDAALLRGLTRAMSNEDFVVLAAVSAAEATAIMRRTQVDIVVCDQRMPGMTGLDFLSNLRKEFPQIRAVLLSGHVGDLPIARRIAQEIGVYCLLSKPCSAAQLSLTIRRALEYA